MSPDDSQTFRLARLLLLLDVADELDAERLGVYDFLAAHPLLFARADELNEDPLHGFLVGLKMMSELMADLPNGHPGCIVASYCYQDRLFDKEVRELNASAVLNWRKRFRQRLDLIAERYPPRMQVDLDDLADMLSVIADGGIIVSKTVKDKQALARQMLLYRDFIKAVFLGVP